MEIEKVSGSKYPHSGGRTAEEKLELNYRAAQLANTKIRCSKSGVKFDIHHKDIEWSTHCPILGIELIRGIENGSSNSPSLDRIEPSKGYVKGNIRVISRLANSMKSNATPEQLEMFAKNIGPYLRGEL